MKNEDTPDEDATDDNDKGPGILAKVKELLDDEETIETIMEEFDKEKESKE